MKVLVFAENKDYCKQSAEAHGYNPQRIICVTPFNEINRSVDLSSCAIIKGELYSTLPSFKKRVLLECGIEESRLEGIRFGAAQWRNKHERGE